MTARARLDAECYYLTASHADLQRMPIEEFQQKHPRYEYLCKIHGTPETTKIENTIADTLISVFLSNGLEKVEKRISKRMTVRAFKTVLARTGWPKMWQKAVRGKVVKLEEDGGIEDLFCNDDTVTLEYLEIQDRTTLSLVF